MSMSYPNRLTVNEVVKSAKSNHVLLSSDYWVPARPLGFASIRSRIALAWAVFTGRADALFWEQQ